MTLGYIQLISERVWQTFSDLGIARERLIEVGWTKASIVVASLAGAPDRAIPPSPGDRAPKPHKWPPSPSAACRPPFSPRGRGTQPYGLLLGLVDYRDKRGRSRRAAGSSRGVSWIDVCRAGQPQACNQLH